MVILKPISQIAQNNIVRTSLISLYVKSEKSGRNQEDIFILKKKHFYLIE